MDGQRIEQSLNQILDKCGEEIIHNHNRFQSAVFDLLDKTNYSEERLILKHAMDSDAFWILLEASRITEDGAKKAIGQIQQESHMTKKDAEFVVRCVAAVRGGNPNITADNVDSSNTEREQQKKKTIQQKEVRKNHQEQGSQWQAQTSVTDTGTKKQIFTAVILAVAFWGVAFIVLYVLYLFGDLEMEDMLGFAVAAAVTVVPAACWMQKVRNSSKKMKVFIIKGVIPGVIFGLAALVLWFMIVEIIWENVYYNDEYRSALVEIMRTDYPEDPEGYSAFYDNLNNGSFYHNGRQYGLTFGQMQVFMWGGAFLVCILFIIVQKIIWNLLIKHKKI